VRAWLRLLTGAGLVATLVLTAGCGRREAEPREARSFLPAAFGFRSAPPGAPAEAAAMRTPLAPGGICGVPGLVGERVAPISGAQPGCGIEQPVQITQVAGLRLSQPAVLNCDAARALDGWVRESAIPVVGRKGGGLAGLEVAASYSCRTRNRQPGARLSEHARGRAIDISAFTLANGSRLSVSEDWRGRHGRMMLALHSSACGRFATVLGPESDAHHQSHFHFDVARHRGGGSYCR